MLKILSSLYFWLNLTEFRKSYPKTRSSSPVSNTKIECLILSPPIATSTSSLRLIKGQLWLVWDAHSSFGPHCIIKPTSFITFLIIILILTLVSEKVMTLDLFSSLIIAFKDPMEYPKRGFWTFKLLLDFKILTQNWIALSLKTVFVSYFSTTSAEASNLPTVKLILRSKICFVIVVGPTNFFMTLTMQGCFFLFTVFFAIVFSLSSMIFF